jgi:hypothetical protein
MLLHAVDAALADAEWFARRFIGAKAARPGDGCQAEVCQTLAQRVALVITVMEPLSGVHLKGGDVFKSLKRLYDLLTVATKEQISILSRDKVNVCVCVCVFVFVCVCVCVCLFLCVLQGVFCCDGYALTHVPASPRLLTCQLSPCPTHRWTSRLTDAACMRLQLDSLAMCRLSSLRLSTLPRSQLLVRRVCVCVLCVCVCVCVCYVCCVCVCVLCVCVCVWFVCVCVCVCVLCVCVCVRARARESTVPPHLS